MQNKYSLVIFDLDGTLADTHRLIFDSFNFVMRKYKSIEMTPAEIMSYFGPPEDVCIRNMLGDGNFQAGWRNYLNYYEDHLDETTLFPGIMDLLSNLRSMRIKLAVFTGKGIETTELTLNFHRIREYFDVVVTGSGVQNHKPHPEGVRLTLRKLNLVAGSAIVVGDSLSDYKAATSAGTDFVAATYDDLARNRFDSLQCQKAKSVKELSAVLLTIKELSA